VWLGSKSEAFAGARPIELLKEGKARDIVVEFRRLKAESRPEAGTPCASAARRVCRAPVFFVFASGRRRQSSGLCLVFVLHPNSMNSKALQLFRALNSVMNPLL
jgi:hypothetical protein